MGTIEMTSPVRGCDGPMDGSLAGPMCLTISVVPELSPSADADLDKLAARVAAKPPAALALTKRLLRDTSESVMERITTEGVHFASCLQSEEAKQVFRKFLNRTKPV